MSKQSDNRTRPTRNTVVKQIKGRLDAGKITPRSNGPFFIENKTSD